MTTRTGLNIVRGIAIHLDFHMKRLKVSRQFDEMCARLCVCACALPLPLQSIILEGTCALIGVLRFHLFLSVATTL